MRLSFVGRRVYSRAISSAYAAGMTQQTGAGWYPVDAYTDRWWDGEQWTGATRPRQPLAPQVMVTRYPPNYRPGMHLLLTICTLGAWLPVWLIDWAVKSYQWRHVKTTAYR